MFIARGAMPDKYREHESIEHSGSVDLVQSSKRGNASSGRRNRMKATRQAERPEAALAGAVAKYVNDPLGLPAATVRAHLD
jgi:hypothetical protein